MRCRVRTKLSVRVLQRDSAADSPPFCAKCSQPSAGAITELVHLRELRGSRPAFRRGGFRLSQPRRGAQSGPRFQIRPANPSPPSARTLAGGDAGRSASSRSPLRSRSCPFRLHPARKRERGFNQAELLAELLSAAAGFPLSAMRSAAHSLHHHPDRNSTGASEWKI